MTGTPGTSDMSGEVYTWSGTGEYRPDRKDADVTSSEHEIRIRVVPELDMNTLRDITGTMTELRTALDDMRSAVRTMSAAFAEAVRVLDNGQDIGDTSTSDVVRVLCHDPGHAWGGTHGHEWTQLGTGDEPDVKRVCPGY